MGLLCDSVHLRSSYDDVYYVFYDNVCSGRWTANVYLDGAMRFLGNDNNDGASTVNIKDNASIINNQARYGGGIYISSGSSVNLLGGTISNNTALGSGGGMYIHSNGYKAWTLSGGWKTSDGIFLNNAAKLLFTSKVENPLLFEGIRNTAGLEGAVVAEGDNGIHPYFRRPITIFL